MFRKTSWHILVCTTKESLKLAVDTAPVHKIVWKGKSQSYFTNVVNLSYLGETYLHFGNRSVGSFIVVSLRTLVVLLDFKSCYDSSYLCFVQFLARLDDLCL